MGTHNRNSLMGTSIKALQVSEQVAKLIELRMAGCTLLDAAEQLGIAPTTARTWIRTYIQHRTSKSVDAFRDQELKTLEDAQKRILEIAQAQHYQFYQGVIVTHDGIPVLDTDPNVRAYIALLKLMERKSRLVGGDKPLPKVEQDQSGGEDPDKTAPQVLTPAMLDAAIKTLTSKIGVGWKMGATDVIPRTVDPVMEEASSDGSAA